MAVASEKSELGIGWAIGISILAHLVFLVLASFLTLVAAVATAQDTPQEIRINFQFPTASKLPGPQIPAGSPLEPVPQSAPARTPPSPPAAPAPALPAQPESTPEPLPRQIVEQPAEQPPAAESPVAASPLEGVEIVDDSGPVAPSRRSMSRAVRDYGRALGEYARQRESRGLADSAGAQNVITPDLSQIPSSGFGVGNLVFESRDFDWSDYGRQIYMAIWRAWHQRLWLTTAEFERWAYEEADWWLDHQTQVRFVIHADGGVTGIFQEAGSGCAPLDQSAIDALSEVVLPPLPSGFPRETEVVHARFLAVGEIRSMRTVLGHLKRMGLF